MTKEVLLQPADDGSPETSASGPAGSPHERAGWKNRLEAFAAAFFLWGLILVALLKLFPVLKTWSSASQANLAILLVGLPVLAALLGRKQRAAIEGTLEGVLKIGGISLLTIVGLAILILCIWTVYRLAVNFFSLRHVAKQARAAGSPPALNLGPKIALISWSLVAVRAIWPKVPANVRPWVIAGVSLFIIALFSWIIITLGHLANS